MNVGYMFESLNKEFIKRSMELDDAFKNGTVTASCTSIIKNETLQDIFKEINKARVKWPGWPADVVHSAAIVAEEAGEALQAALNYQYKSGFREDRAKIKEELLHTIVTAVRFLEEWEGFK
jgi:hypothetical protein